MLSEGIASGTRDLDGFDGTDGAYSNNLSDHRLEKSGTGSSRLQIGSSNLQKAGGILNLNLQHDNRDSSGHPASMQLAQIREAVTPKSGAQFGSASDFESTSNEPSLSQVHVVGGVSSAKYSIGSTSLSTGAASKSINRTTHQTRHSADSVPSRFTQIVEDVELFEFGPNWLLFPIVSSVIVIGVAGLITYAQALDTIVAVVRQKDIQDEISKCETIYFIKTFQKC